jgi:hypothetical protein
VSDEQTNALLAEMRELRARIDRQIEIAEEAATITSAQTVRLLADARR